MPVWKKGGVRGDVNVTQRKKVMSVKAWGATWNPEHKDCNPTPANALHQLAWLIAFVNDDVNVCRSGPPPPFLPAPFLPSAPAPHHLSTG